MHFSNRFISSLLPVVLAAALSACQQNEMRTPASAALTSSNASAVNSADDNTQTYQAGDTLPDGRKIRLVDMDGKPIAPFTVNGQPLTFKLVKPDCQIASGAGNGGTRSCPPGEANEPKLEPVFESIDAPEPESRAAPKGQTQ